MCTNTKDVEFNELLIFSINVSHVIETFKILKDRLIVKDEVSIDKMLNRFNDYRKEIVNILSLKDFNVIIQKKKEINSYDELCTIEPISQNKIIEIIITGIKIIQETFPIFIADMIKQITSPQLKIPKNDIILLTNELKGSIKKMTLVTNNILSNVESNRITGSDFYVSSSRIFMDFLMCVDGGVDIMDLISKEKE